MRRIEVKGGQLRLNDDIEEVIEKTVTRFGTGAKVDCLKEHIGKKVYLLIRKGK